MGLQHVVGSGVNARTKRLPELPSCGLRSLATGWGGGGRRWAVGRARGQGRLALIRGTGREWRETKGTQMPHSSTRRDFIRTSAQAAAAVALAPAFADTGARLRARGQRQHRRRHHRHRHPRRDPPPRHQDRREHPHRRGRRRLRHALRARPRARRPRPPHRPRLQEAARQQGRAGGHHRRARSLAQADGARRDGTPARTCTSRSR